MVGIIALSSLSLPIRKTPWFEISHPKSWQLDPSAMLSSLHAAENDWGFVRQSAEWARGNSTFIDQVLASVRENRWLDESNEFLNVPVGNQRFDLKVVRGGSFNIESSAYENTRTFQNSFELRRAQQKDLALQLFFNSPEELDATGALMYYNLQKLVPEEGFFDSSENTIVETWVFRREDGLRRQVYTWKDSPGGEKAITLSGRVVLDEVLDGKTLCFRTGVLVDGQVILNALNSNLGTQTVDFLYGPGGCNTAKGNNLYYALTYMQHFDFPFLTTAKYGWTGNGERKEGFCGVQTPQASTNNNYGLFDDKGFVRDGVPANQVPGNYPRPEGSDSDMTVQTAWWATFNDGSGGLNYVPSAKGSDDTSKAFLDGINSNPKIGFK